MGEREPKKETRESIEEKVRQFGRSVAAMNFAMYDAAPELQDLIEREKAILAERREKIAAGVPAEQAQMWTRKEVHELYDEMRVRERKLWDKYFHELQPALGEEEARRLYSAGWREVQREAFDDEGKRKLSPFRWLDPEWKE